MKWLWLALLGVLLPALPVGLGCTSQPLLHDVRVDPARIRPDGSGIASQAQIHYALARRAYVTMTVVTPDGAVHPLRDGVLRAPDRYEVRFDGSVPMGEGANRRVLADGSYTVKIRAVDLDGGQSEQMATLAIEGADTTPLEVSNLVVQPTTITPNNDGEEDESVISYSLSKEAEVTVFATAAEGKFALLQPPTKQQGEAGMPAPWDGRENGGRLLPDGTYTIHVIAVDKSGNVTEATREVTLDNGGTPRMAITKVKFWPPIVPLNGTLRVEISVKNIGDTRIKTLGPDSGTRYTLRQSYASFVDEKGTPRYYERPGLWRVGVSWSSAPQPYPIRWGWGQEYLDPGEEVTVGGEILVDAQLSRTGTYFWAGIEQGGVGFHDTNKGQTEIRFAY